MTDQYDDKVRARLAEIRAAAGIPHAQASLEVLYFLPADFLRQYEQLFSTALRVDNGEDTRARGQVAAADLGKSQTPAARRDKKRFKKVWAITNPAALELKSRIDKRLRVLSKDIAEGLVDLRNAEAGEGEQAQNQCERCHLFMQATWIYCPKCGWNRGHMRVA